MERERPFHEFERAIKALLASLRLDQVWCWFCASSQDSRIFVATMPCVYQCAPFKVKKTCMEKLAAEECRFPSGIHNALRSGGSFDFAFQKEDHQSKFILTTFIIQPNAGEATSVMSRLPSERERIHLILSGRSTCVRAHKSTAI